MTVFVRKLHLFFSNLMTIPHLWRKNTMDVDENEKRCRINVVETTTHQLIDNYQNLLLKSVLGLVNFLWVAGHLFTVEGVTYKALFTLNRLGFCLMYIYTISPSFIFRIFTKNKRIFKLYLKL
jgi:hypothetical protein